MWALKNHTPYAVGRNWTRGTRGEHRWLVAVKATLDILPGGLVLADEQLEPTLAPEYHGDPGASSLKYDSDLLTVKPGTDVLVAGSAYAPSGRPARSVPVSLRAADIDKSLVVRGERVFYVSAGGLATTEPRPFETRPIVYEVAFGGKDLTDPDPKHHRIDARNPVGRGFATSAHHLENQLAQAVEYPAGNPADLGPAGFGPVDRAWSPRLGLAGTYDARWEAAQKPLLPTDYDERYGLSAPADQRPTRDLVGGERIEIVNMTASGLLRFDLPRVGLSFTTRFGPRREEHTARLTSVIVETEGPRVLMVWQTTLRVPARDVEYLDETTIEEKNWVPG
jgi:hypothetical protein